jgi:hypothetical protein
MKFVFLSIFSKIFLKNSSFILKLTRITGTLHQDQRIFLITTRSVLLRARNISDKSFRENRKNINFMLNNFFLNRVFYEIMWENTVELDRPRALQAG